MIQKHEDLQRKKKITCGPNHVKIDLSYSPDALLCYMNFPDFSLILLLHIMLIFPKQANIEAVLRATVVVWWYRFTQHHFCFVLACFCCNPSRDVGSSIDVQCSSRRHMTFLNKVSIFIYSNFWVKEVESLVPFCNPM